MSNVRAGVPRSHTGCPPSTPGHMLNIIWENIFWPEMLIFVRHIFHHVEWFFYLFSTLRPSNWISFGREIEELGVMVFGIGLGVYGLGPQVRAKNQCSYWVNPMSKSKMWYGFPKCHNRTASSGCAKQTIIIAGTPGLLHNSLGCLGKALSISYLGMVMPRQPWQVCGEGIMWRNPRPVFKMRWWILLRAVDPFPFLKAFWRRSPRVTPTNSRGIHYLILQPGCL